MDEQMIMKCSCEKLEPLPVCMHILERLLFLIYFYIYIYHTFILTLILLSYWRLTFLRKTSVLLRMKRWKAAATASGKAVHMQPLTHSAFWLLLFGHLRSIRYQSITFQSCTL